MGMTLAQMKVGMADKVAQQIVDIFLRESEILQVLPFDNCVSPSGGSTLTYGYLQKKLPSVASFRAVGSDYSGTTEATVEEKTVGLKVFGGKFEMDRVLKAAEGPYNNMAFQIQEQILAAVSLFHYTLVNGDATTYTTQFDGLDKMLTSTSSEFGTGSYIDVSSLANLKTNADALYEAMQNLIASTHADALLMNTATIGKVQTMARLLGYKTESEEAFGRRVVSMDGVRFMDLGKNYTVSGTTVTGNDCVKSGITRTIGSGESASSVTGLTDIYAVKFDINDGFHAASLTGDNAIKTYLPDFNAPGALKIGEVEMVAATVLKNTANAGVLRNVKIA